MSKIHELSKEKISKILLLASLILFSLSIIFGITAFYKISVYENSEYSWEDTKNAYVGGDAYNYIINGTYFSGYCALSGALLICASISAVSGFFFIFEARKEDVEKKANELPEL